MAGKSNQKKSVDEIIIALPKDEQVIVKRLRGLIRECLPHATEKNNYGAPYYTRHRMIVFIWPPSLYWGAKPLNVQSKGVTLGFCQGNRMSNDDDALLSEGRKQVYCMYFKHLKEVNDEQVRALLFEADMIDKQFARKKK
ncbi:MAG TPA: DUF1801 domain-containing protein [Ohtaekwangia sp.]|nr:DUF1801 domain-containing protein [Ohtaekwangia sp.]